MYDFASPGHVADYLCDTIVRSSSHGPVYVQGLYDDGDGMDLKYVEMVIRELPYNKSKTYRVNLGELDFRPIPIGMCNLLDKNGIPVDAAYITRIPARRWKIGLSNQGVRPFPVRVTNNSEWNPWFFEPGPTHASWLTQEPGACMINNDYPSYDQAMEYMDGYTRRSCAFSRNFAIDAVGHVFYRWHKEPVGKCGSRPHFYVKYDDLQEVLEEDGYKA